MPYWLLILMLILSNFLFGQDSLQVETTFADSSAVLFALNSDTNARAGIVQDTLSDTLSYMMGYEDGRKGIEKTKYYFQGVGGGALLMGATIGFAILSRSLDSAAVITAIGLPVSGIVVAKREAPGSKPQKIPATAKQSAYERGFAKGSAKTNKAYYVGGACTLGIPVALGGIGLIVIISALSSMGPH